MCRRSASMRNSSLRNSSAKSSTNQISENSNQVRDHIRDDFLLFTVYFNLQIIILIEYSPVLQDVPIKVFQ